MGLVRRGANRGSGGPLMPRKRCRRARLPPFGEIRSRKTGRRNGRPPVRAPTDRTERRVKVAADGDGAAPPLGPNAVAGPCSAGLSALAVCREAAGSARVLRNCRSSDWRTARRSPLRRNDADDARPEAIVPRAFPVPVLRFIRRWRKMRGDLAVMQGNVIFDKFQAPMKIRLTLIGALLSAAVLYPAPNVRTKKRSGRKAQSAHGP